VELRVTLLREGARLPSRAHQGDAGLDLHAAEPATIGAGERASVGTGIAVEIPPGHAGLVLPRSGLAARHGIALVNSPGLIDSGYRGEVRVLLLNTDRADPFEVQPGDRIAQLVVTPCAAAEPVEAVGLENLGADVLAVSGASPVRGAGGFGSSGR
jgi:dUTP diphosphatase